MLFYATFRLYNPLGAEKHTTQNRAKSKFIMPKDTYNSSLKKQN